jgi:hypothetical protein
LTHDTYTGVAAAGEGSIGQRERDMKKILEDWEENWQKLSTEKDKVMAETNER